MPFEDRICCFHLKLKAVDRSSQQLRLTSYVFDSGSELEVVRMKTSFRVSRVRSGQNPDVRAARKQVRDARVFYRAVHAA